METKQDQFLDRLTGSWRLSGTMGSTPLRQAVQAEWVLGGQFVQMHFVQEGPVAEGRQRYEALYLLGYDRERDEYLMHLFDTFGPGYARTIGVGTRRGDSVEFLFDYPGALFTNTFTWDQESGQWEMDLQQRDEGGEWTLFANKRLAPAG